MLWFIGLGLSGINSISQQVEKILKQADIVYFEQFTSPIRKTELKQLKQKIKGSVKIGKRWLVEDGREILENAKKRNVVLLSYGDPFIATTHIELRTRAILEKIKTKAIHNASSITSMVGECGLHYYKVGKIVTITSEFQTMKTVYFTIYHNLTYGNHTILLLEYNEDSQFFLKPNDALEELLETEKELGQHVISSSTYAIVASRVGLDSQKIVAGKISTLKNLDFGKSPHSIIIPGSLHFTEIDALKVLAKCKDEPAENSNKIQKISSQMIEKYVPIVKKALKEIIPYYKNSTEFQTVLENAELYIQDAKKFLEEGKDEVAILSIGYADGLVDALRMAKGLRRQI
jgi:diphthine synthase